jgi:4-phytase/acid phosphatase
VNSNRFCAALLAAIIFSWTLQAAPQLKYVVIVARHGVRSPTWDTARLNQYSIQPWPDWDVPPGDLTPHGRKLIAILGAYYREWLANEHLLNFTGCGDQGRIYIWADTDQRTLETGRAFAESILPGCGVPVNSRPTAKKDPLFGGLQSADPRLASQAVRERLGANPQQLLADHRTALDTLQFILDGGRATPKKLIASPAEIQVAVQDKTIELQGPFAAASTLSEDFLLEYANGMRGPDLGWGRLTKDNLFQVLELHRVYTDLMRRTPYLARTRGSNLMAHILASMEQAASEETVQGALGPTKTALLILSGHDTNQSNVAGMLNLTWTLPSYQADDTPPEGALIFSLWRNPDGGKFFVQAEYLAPSLDQMGNADVLTMVNPPLRRPVSIPGCEAASQTLPCSWQNFKTHVQRSIEGSQVDFDAR